MYLGDSAVDVTTGYGAGRLRGQNSSPGTVKNFLFSTSSRPALGPIQPPIQWVPEALSPEVKRPGRQADNSPPASAEVKKMWICTSTPPYVFMALSTRKTLPYLSRTRVNVAVLPSFPMQSGTAGVLQIHLTDGDFFLPWRTIALGTIVPQTSGKVFVQRLSHVIAGVLEHFTAPHMSESWRECFPFLGIK
jgi:hypothetical protein